MHAHLTQQHVEAHRQATALKEANQALRAELHLRTQGALIRERELLEEAEHKTRTAVSLTVPFFLLTPSANLAQAQVSLLEMERNRQAAQLLLLRSQVTSLEQRLRDQDHSQRRMATMSEELLVWEEQRKEVEQLRLRLRDLETTRKMCETHVEQAHSAADQAQTSLASDPSVPLSLHLLARCMLRSDRPLSEMGGSKPNWRLSVRRLRS